MFYRLLERTYEVQYRQIITHTLYPPCLPCRDPDPTAITLSGGAGHLQGPAGEGSSAYALTNTNTLR
jgi:hypothetical protein